MGTVYNGSSINGTGSRSMRAAKAQKRMLNLGAEQTPPKKEVSISALTHSFYYLYWFRET